jgi:calcineurin-like phosphoesterase family protein
MDDIDMSRNWFTSDLHFRHKAILAYTDRPKHLQTPVTESIENALRIHDQWLVDTINKHVGERDQLYFVGDMVIGNNPWIAGYWLSQIKCVHKHLISSIWKTRPGFSRPSRSTATKSG